METENLKFRIGLSGTSPSKQPEFKLLINGSEKLHTTLTKDPGVTEYFEFDEELSEGDQTLTIQFLNKGYGDTVLDEKRNILSDLLLNIDSIEIDDIDLGPLKWTISEYCPEYSSAYVSEHLKMQAREPDKILKSCVNLGWNGTWSITFQSPFYIWLLENI